jgi:hypothetical protein
MGRAVAALPPESYAKLRLLFAVTHGAALALASLAGGILVGRFGGERIGPREAALAGIMAALIATVLSWQGPSWLPLVALALAGGFAALGGRIGVERRPI